MLVLSRTEGQTVIINKNITVHVVRVKGNRIRLGIDAPDEVPIKRGELQEREEDIDQALQESGLDYVRYMDDWIVLAPTRWRLRRAISITNRVLECLKIRQHRDKTFIGRIAATFTFLGFTFSESGIVSVAIATMAKFVARCHRLYERNAPQRRAGDYRRRWLSWVRSVLTPASVESATDDKCEQAERPDQPCLRFGYRSA